MTKPYIIGIAGGSASGKSTFCERLEQNLSNYKVLSIHTDHYFKSKDIRPLAKAPITGKIYLDDNHPETLNLSQLRQDLKEAICDKKADIIIIEGLLVLADEVICDMLNLKLFIECRADERIVRRLKRNMARGLSFDEIANVYLDMVRYRHDEFVEPSKWKADFILNGSNFSEKALELITASVELFVGQRPH